MNNCFWGEDGVFAMGYRLILPEKYSLGESDFDLLNEYWTRLLKNLPSGTIFFKQDIFVESKLNTENYKSNDFLQKSTKNHFNNLDYLDHKTNMFFILPNTSIKFSRLKNPIRPPQKKEFLEFDEKIKNFASSIEQSIDFLKSLKISDINLFDVYPLTKKYIDNYYDYINNGLNENYRVDIKGESGNKGAWEYLRVGEQYASVIKFPREDKMPEILKTCREDREFSNKKVKFFKNYGDNFSYDLSFTHIYNQIAVIDDAKYHYNRIEKNKDNFNRYRRVGTKNKIWAEDTQRLLEEMAQKEERIIRGHNNVVVFAKSKEELTLRINEVSVKMKDIDIVGDRAFGKNLMALYEYSFPLNAHLFVEQYYYIGSLELFSSFLILTGGYRNDEEGIRLNSRLKDMTPVIVDIWDGEKKYSKARNFFILAPTGGGKSFCANHIISYYFEDGAKQVIVDLGGSYRKLSSLFPNDVVYITYKEGESLGINPFELNEGEKITTEKIDELVEFIGVHYSRGVDLTEEERATLRLIVELYYKNIQYNHSLPSFIKSFIVDKDEVVKYLNIKTKFFNVDKFVLLMSEFIDNGVYSFLYDESKTSIGKELYNKKIVVFELDSIRENKFLLSIMLQLISSTIDKVIWKDKTTRGIILFDEVAEQLKWEGMLSRIQWFYQAIRKQNGGIGIILQTINQLPDNPLSKAIVDNTQTVYVLEANDYEPIKIRFNLSDHAFYQMNSLKSQFNRGRSYSELFLLRGNHHQVYRLEVPKQVWWAYQTEGEKNDVLMAIYDQLGDMEKAINFRIQNDSNILPIENNLKKEKINQIEMRKKINQIIKNYEKENL